MNKKQYLSLLCAAIISGLVSGAGFNRLFFVQTVSSQSNPSTIVSAQEFRLVDANGKLRAILSGSPIYAAETPSLVLFDTNQKARIALGTYRTTLPTFELMDENGMGTFYISRSQGTTSLFMNNVFSKPGNDGAVERVSYPALSLTHNLKGGGNIRIFDEKMTQLWSARKPKAAK